MKTFKRVCLEDWTLQAENGDTLDLKRGKEYITSTENEDGEVVVYTNFWVAVPARLFAGERLFTS